MSWIFQIIIGLWVLATLSFLAYCGYLYMTTATGDSTTKTGRILRSIGLYFIIWSVTALALAFAIVLILVATKTLG